ncbi:IclR family transcriptional regulator [Streptomonospora litoralis]|uniref:Transcriptional regulator KdgR n=1 Tax=Streptomonospora litoralis TaxID=2498135 RepID=A0A4P6Q1B3_9ACTN|nr:IclR family transcriptional regulator [Streptomonospora litoralis]QBI53011.1 Transcriptional regulator KdgR [Streptomonospora litoralis]
MTGRADGKGVRVQSLVRAFAVVDRIARDSRGATLGELIAETGLNRTTVWRLVANLTELGVLHNGWDGRYTLGPHLVTLGTAARRQLVGAPEISALLLRLRDTTQETCHFAVPDGDRMVYLEKVESTRSVRAASRVGGHIPLHSTALGRVYLATADVSVRDSLLGRIELTARTPNTITDRKRLEAELARIAEQGWALDDEENEEAIRCIAAPVTGAQGQPVAAVSVSVPVQRLPLEQVPELTSRVVATARRLSEVFRAASDDRR